MEVLLGFLTTIAAQLLKMTYLNRTQPETLATEVLSELQIQVLQAKATKSIPSVLTIAWAMESVARWASQYYGEDGCNSKISVKDGNYVVLGTNKKN